MRSAEILDGTIFWEALVMDLSTTYLGLQLEHPFMVGASPIAADLDGIRRLEDGGAAAIVLPSLFEEQITEARNGRIHHMDPLDPSFAGVLAEFPLSDRYAFTPDTYLEHVRRAKSAVRIPVIASLNGTNGESWLLFARDLQSAGADAVEMNFYDVIVDPSRAAPAVEGTIVNVATELAHILTIPIAMKMSPYYTALGNLAQRLAAAGADGLVLFNRFLEPDLDVSTLSVNRAVDLSTSAELRLRLQWVAMLKGRIDTSLAVGGGIAGPTDGIKAILAGADAVQAVSAILRNGCSYFRMLREGLTQWMDAHDMNTMSDVCGRLSVSSGVDVSRWQRANYIRTLQSWTGHGDRTDASTGAE
jgi:dihydroorotate dehydrogenase (fumarate)